MTAWCAKKSDPETPIVKPRENPITGLDSPPPDHQRPIHPSRPSPCSGIGPTPAESPLSGQKKPVSVEIRQNAVLAAEKSVLTRPRWIGLQRSRSARETNEAKHPAHHLLYFLAGHFLLKNVPSSNFPNRGNPIFLNFGTIVPLWRQGTDQRPRFVIKQLKRKPGDFYENPFDNQYDLRSGIVDVPCPPIRGTAPTLLPGL